MFFFFVAGKSCNMCETFRQYSMRVCGDFTKQSSVVMARLCVCVCVCVCARARARTCVRERGGEREREGGGSLCLLLTELREGRHTM